MDIMENPNTNKASEPIPINNSMKSSAGSTSTGSLYGSSPFDIYGFIHSLSNWLRGIEEKEFNEEEYREKEQDLWKDWEWILSTTEEFLLKQNQSETQKVLSELDNLKKTASNLKIKPIFINRAIEYLSILSDDDASTLKQPLDSNKRLGIINSVINLMEPQWLSYIQEKFFTNEIDSIHRLNTNSPSLSSYSPIPKQSKFNSMKNDEEDDEDEDYSDDEDEHNNDSIIDFKSVPLPPPLISSQDKDSSIEEGWIEDSFRSPLFPSNGQLLPPPPAIENENVTQKEEEGEEQTKITLNDSLNAISDMIVLNKNLNKITWEQFMENFKGQKYSKGVNTRMKDIGWQASHGVDGSLSSRVIGDISWSIWNTLATAIKSIREITYEESIELTEQVIQLQPLLIQYWISTKKNSTVGSKNEGIVVEKWKIEEMNKKKKIAELKKSGTLDKYSPQRVKILSHEKKDLSSIRATLENKLKLKTR